MLRFQLKPPAYQHKKSDAAHGIKITNSKLVRDFIYASREGDEDGKGTINIQLFLAQSF